MMKKTPLPVYKDLEESVTRGPRLLSTRPSEFNQHRLSWQSPPALMAVTLPSSSDIQHVVTSSLSRHITLHQPGLPTGDAPSDTTRTLTAAKDRLASSISRPQVGSKGSLPKAGQHSSQDKTRNTNGITLLILLSSRFTPHTPPAALQLLGAAAHHLPSLLLKSYSQEPAHQKAESSLSQACPLTHPSTHIHTPSPAAVVKFSSRTRVNVDGISMTSGGHLPAVSAMRETSSE